MVFMLLFGCATKTVIVEKDSDPCKEAEHHFRQALTYSKDQDYNNSELEFLKAIELCPNYSEAHANLGVVYMHMNALNKAERSLKEAVELDPNDPFALYNLTALYSLTNKLDLALDTLDDALNNGFNDIDTLRGDPDLKNLRREPGFTKILEKHHIFLK
jgi:Flp pilus assembly protein TadD